MCGEISRSRKGSRRMMTAEREKMGSKGRGNMEKEEGRKEEG